MKVPRTEGGRSPAGDGRTGADLPPELRHRRAVLLDNRGLEPPEPMQRVLESLESLSPGEYLHVHNDREPLFLYPILDARGYIHRAFELEDGSFYIFIWRPDDT